LLVVLCHAAGVAQAQAPALFPRDVYRGETFLGSGESVPNGTAYYHAFCIKKFVNSFTSYQFPNPFPPNQDPLSRLEFPIDQWFGGLTAGCAAAWWSLNCLAWTNLSRDSALKMQDSDWDDETNPFQKTIFSDSLCRLNRSLLVDVNVTVGSSRKSLLNIRPIFGYRYQMFHFTTHDGLQSDLSGNVSDLPGDGIEFMQIFSHYYVGAIFKPGVAPGEYWSSLRGVRLVAQIDYALVNAVNEDLHLLRAGERITRENTKGHCWHASLSASLAITNQLRARLDGDFKRIFTTGDHRLINNLFSVDFSFDGSRVWSDQASVSATAELAF
jgi:outer membrane protease